MDTYHRVYARFDDSLWVGVNWLARRRPLTSEDEYVVLPMAQRHDVCLTLPDGRTLCDYGPEHEHG